MTLDTNGPNAEQIRYWNETAAPKWVEYHAVLDTQLEALGRTTMDRARLVAGERVLDVGCGCGATTRALAARVGPTGSAHGIDISAPMLARAAALTRDAGLANVRFTNADAQTQRFEPATADVLFSRFGVMFFADPPAAFRNLRGALRPGGRLAFVCWQPLVENPWLLVPLGAAAQLIQLPPPPAPGAPGPFAFGDPDRVRGILEQAGFAAVAFEPVRVTLTVGGGGLDEAVHFLLEGVGPTSAALREADPALRPRVFAAVREALAPFVTPEGVRMPAAAWIVTATAPGV
jgi:SAM-dependent methyltransferase